MSLAPIERIRRKFPNLQAAPQVNRNSGLNGALPNAYDSNWQLYTDLTPAQIAAFQAMPEWQNFLNYVALAPKTATVAVPTSVVESTLAIAANSLQLQHCSRRQS